MIRISSIHTWSDGPNISSQMSTPTVISEREQEIKKAVYLEPLKAVFTVIQEVAPERLSAQRKEWWFRRVCTALVSSILPKFPPPAATITEKRHKNNDEFSRHQRRECKARSPLLTMGGLLACLSLSLLHTSPPSFRPTHLLSKQSFCRHWTAHAFPQNISSLIFSTEPVTQ